MVSLQVWKEKHVDNSYGIERRWNEGGCFKTTKLIPQQEDILANLQV